MKEIKKNSKKQDQDYEDLDTSKIPKDNALGIEFPFYTLRD